MENNMITNITNYKNIGFLLDDIAPSQVAYSCIFNSNQYLAKNNDLTVCLFYDNMTYPCTYPLFPRFHSRDCVGFDGLLVSTSLESSNFLKQNHRAKKVFYIQDIEWERARGQKLDLSILYDESIIKICRSKDHLEYIKSGCKDKTFKTPINLVDTIVSDFDISVLKGL